VGENHHNDFAGWEYVRGNEEEGGLTGGRFDDAV
jgi:hypothetical protein